MKKKLPFIIGGVFIILLIVAGVFFYLYQYTEVFGKKVIPTKIQTISIQYVPGLDFKSVDVLNEKEKTIQMQTITLSGNDFQTVKKCLSKIHENNLKQNDLWLDYYHVILNKNITLQVGDGFGSVVKGKSNTNVIIPRDCNSTFQSIIEKNNKKVLTKLTSDHVTVKMEGSSITIQNEDNLNYVKESLNYYPISMKADYKTYKDGYKAEVILDNNIRVYLYESKIGYILKKEGEKDASTYAIFPDDVYDIIERIYKISVE